MSCKTSFRLFIYLHYIYIIYLFYTFIKQKKNGLHPTRKRVVFSPQIYNGIVFRSLRSVRPHRIRQHRPTLSRFRVHFGAYSYICIVFASSLPSVLQIHFLFRLHIVVRFNFKTKRTGHLLKAGTREKYLLPAP